MYHYTLPISAPSLLPCRNDVQVKLHNEKRSELEEQQLHLNIGLRKIKETLQQVEEMQKSLSIKRSNLNQKNDDANQKLKEMVKYHYIIYYICNI